MILVGNKCDMEDERVISFERGKQLADSLGLEFYETSAKENINVRVSSHPTVSVIHAEWFIGDTMEILILPILMIYDDIAPLCTRTFTQPDITILPYS